MNHRPFKCQLLSSCLGLCGDDDIGTIDYFETGIDQLIALIDEVVARHASWTTIQQTRAGIAAWEVGLNQILRYL